MAEIILNKVNKTFGKVHVTKEVDLHINKGDFVVFVGPSGCGKSTLLRLIAGLEDITSGDLKIDGKVCNDLPPPERGIGMVFQSYALYPHMTVYDNMAFGLKLAKAEAKTVDEKVREVAAALQLDTLLARKPKALSGGQRQRVAIGRAIVREPKVFLFDEPLSNLDASLRVQMRMEIARLHERLGATMIYVTHDQVEAMTLATKIVVLDAGRVEQVGSPLELYNHPANTFVAGFIGSPKMNFLTADIVEPGEVTTKVQIHRGQAIVVSANTIGAKVGDPCVVGIRPEHIRFGEKDAIQEGGVTLSVVEQLGNECLMYFNTPQSAEPVVIRTEGQTNIRAGDKRCIEFPADYCHLFDRDGKAFKRSVAGETKPSLIVTP
ncbi:ABC transporter ATP-binding protein [Grimontia hollisae]|uniref:Maltose/maltodextrin import ATP-binding protein MalK n=1 Tax=Grimontia hollisae TaxID=673 RepID=A0A377J7Q7_GRIHO|nr:sn-glycerol-3-phosphate ABC transporter ATP-binding protein UgpC [Grimontia hollisae]MDF2184692.1 sn-glycerol-3-phosphate ABC transporter ATP-binding protein UgpC [Grimontia hollisae]STO98408.1 Maltose/maltodextrin import ATP-binding protein MalK [Grimontia hollisae]